MSTKVQLKATQNGGSVQWDLDGNAPKSHRIDVAKGAKPEEIEFKLDDDTNLDLRFDCSMPFQVWSQAGCPPPGINSDQIQVIACSKDKVTVVDLNTGPAVDLHYQLNVVAKDGTAYPCDPIIRNGGGGPGLV